MKLTEWLKTILVSVVEKPEDADLFLSASDLKAVEVPDDIQKAFNERYLTRDRAMSDEKIIRELDKKAKGQILDMVDARVKKIVPLLSEEDQKLLALESSSLNKLEILANAIPNLSKNDDVKKASEVFRKKEADLHEKISLLEDQIKKKDANFDKQIKDVKLDYVLRTKVAGFDLAPEFSDEEHRNFLADSTIHFLKSNYKVEFDDKDERVLHLRKEVDGAITDVYEGNNIKVTLDDVLKKRYEKFLKKSSGSGSDQGKPNPEPRKRQELPTDKPLTLREKMAAAQSVKA